MTQARWSLVCSSCNAPAAMEGASVCPSCGQPLFAGYAAVPRSTELENRWDMWRYSAFLPLLEGEKPVSIGEGLTPLIETPALAREIGVRRLLIKDESQNPTGSFKARGMSAAVTRVKGAGAPGIVVPTAGNAGAALAAYGAAAGVPVRVFAPGSTPKPILDTIEAMGATLIRVDGHIGDAGKAANAFAAESGYASISTLREPYRVEGMKTMGFEIAEQLGWRAPDVLVYPTGGGEGTVGIWKAFNELRAGGWLPPDFRQPSYVVAQAAGCAPLVRAFESGAETAFTWENPVTSAAGLRVPTPFGDRLLLNLMRESGGLAASADETRIEACRAKLASSTGIDASPEGGCALAVLEAAVKSARIGAGSEVVLFNTGSGASYRT